MLVDLLPKNSLWLNCARDFLESACQLSCYGLKIRAEQTAVLQRVHEESGLVGADFSILADRIDSGEESLVRYFRGSRLPYR